MKISITQATSGPGPAKQNYRMASILSFLSDMVSGSTLQGDTLVWAVGSDARPIDQSERMYAIHRTLISADMDATACSANTSVAALYIALNNRHAIAPGWYEYSSSKRSGIKCRVFVGADNLRAVEIRQDPYGVQHNFVPSMQSIASHMEYHASILALNITDAAEEPGITEAALRDMRSRLIEVISAKDLLASEAEVEKLLDQLHALYDFSKPNPKLEQLWGTVVQSVKDTPEDLAELASHIEARKKRMGEDGEHSLRVLLRKLGYSA